MFSPQKCTLIVGLGKTGLSCVRFLAGQGFSCLSVTDSRAQPPGLAQLQQEWPMIPVQLGGFRADFFAAAEQIVLSPGVSLREPLLQQALQRGIPVIGDIELFAQQQLQSPNPAKIIAITGSNGKSTVTAWLGFMAEKAGLCVKVGGNLGTPALDLWREAQSQQQSVIAYILELSSFQLETTASLHPTAAVVLNISPDHMDRYATVADYAAAKQRIYQGKGVMVVNADDPAVMAMIAPGRAVIPFSLSPPSAASHFGVCEHQQARWLCQGEQLLLPVRALSLVGQHNVANALAALALGQAAGFPMAAMLEALQQFPGLPHRMQRVADHRGVRWYNDSKATNVGATLAALQGLEGQVVLLAGGDGKAADFSALKMAVAEKARAVILFGRDAPLIAQVLQAIVPVVCVERLEQAIPLAARHAQPGDSVLLAPACASFDQYRNYEHRGDHFASLVMQWVKG